MKIAKFLRSYPRDYQCEKSVQKFVDIGEPSVEVLISLLESKDEIVVGIAAQALGKLGATRAISALVATLSNFNVNNEYAVKKMVIALILFGRNAVPHIMSRMNEPLVNKQIFCDILRQIGDPTVIPILHEYT